MAALHCVPLSVGMISPNKPGRRQGRSGLMVRAKGRDEEESGQILKAFFVGKALADTLNERVGSAVGELLSELGQRQAQQQKQVRMFQEEVEERARVAMEAAAAARRDEAKDGEQV